MTSEDREPLLKAVEITKTFCDPTPLAILQGVSLEIHRGESVVITGKSGEGKSTLLHILGTLDNASSGSLEICGQRATQAHSAKLRNRHIGFIFQAFHLLEEESVIANVLMPAKIARLPTGKKSDAYKRALALLDQVGLSSRALFLAKNLSGGEKQRAAIARALINDPDLIFADEPTGNLDQTHSEQIYHLLLSLLKEKKSLLIVTHEKELAALCDKRYLLHNGRLYRERLKNRETSKEASQIFRSQRVTLPKRQDTREDETYGVKPTPDGTDSSITSSINRE